MKGLEEDDTVIICTLDFTSEDHTLFMPLWAGMPDEQHAQIMIGRALLDASRFNRPFGIPACPVSPSGSAGGGSPFHRPCTCPGICSSAKACCVMDSAPMQRASWHI